MCVGWEAVILELTKDMAVVDASGAKREVSTELMQDVSIGDSVMVHAGTIIAKTFNDTETEEEHLLEENE